MWYNSGTREQRPECSSGKDYKMDRDEAIQIVCRLDAEQYELLQQFLYQLTCLEEKRKEGQTPDQEETK